MTPIQLVLQSDRDTVCVSGFLYLTCHHHQPGHAAIQSESTGPQLDSFDLSLIPSSALHIISASSSVGSDENIQIFHAEEIKQNPW